MYRKRVFTLTGAVAVAATVALGATAMADSGAGAESAGTASSTVAARLSADSGNTTLTLVAKPLAALPRGFVELVGKRCSALAKVTVGTGATPGQNEIGTVSADQDGAFGGHFRLGTGTDPAVLWAACTTPASPATATSATVKVPG